MNTKYTPTRPIMSAAELQSHHAKRHGRVSCGDGYDDMDLNERLGWVSHSAWGLDGWDLGDWPYVVISTSSDGNKFFVLSVVEGDHDIYEFDTEADQFAAVDYLFLWYMQRNNSYRAVTVDREELDAGNVTVDDQYRGPYRRDRRELGD